MRRGAALTGALLATLATPATWPLALAAFLLRGGILLVALPIVVLPTPIGIGDALAPAIMSIALGTLSVEIVAISAAVGMGIVAWLILGGWLAAALEAEGARIVALDEDVAALRGPAAAAIPLNSGGDGRVAARILAARLVAYVPLGLALSWGSIRLVRVAYDELTSPLDVSTPIVLRIVRASPEIVVAIVAAWMVGEIVGAVAARRIALAGDGVIAGLRTGLVTAVRHPLVALARFWLPTLLLLMVLVPSALAAAAALRAANEVLGDRRDPFPVLATVVLFVVLWTAGLLLTGVVCAWRAAVWTVADVAREGTFGVSPDRRPGDWHPDRSSATL